MMVLFYKNNNLRVVIKVTMVEMFSKPREAMLWSSQTQRSFGIMLQGWCNHLSRTSQCGKRETSCQRKGVDKDTCTVVSKLWMGLDLL